MKREALRLRLIRTIERDRINDSERLAAGKLMYNVIHNMEMLYASSFGDLIFGLNH